LRQLMVLARRGKGLEAAAEDQLKSGRFASAYALSRIHGEYELKRDAPDFGAVARCFGLACEAMVRLERVRPAVEMAARSRQLFDSGVLDSERAVGAYARTLLLQGNSAHLDAMLITPAEALKTLRAALRFHEEAERVARKLQLHDLLQDALEGQARALAELARRDAVAEITVLHGRASEVIRQALALPEIDAKRRTRLSLLDLELRMRSAETAHEVDALAELAKVRSELEAMRTQAGKDESDDVAWRTSHLLARCKFAQANIFRMREFGCWRRQTRSEWIEERRWNYSPEALRWMASALEDVRSATQFAERLGQSLPWVESMVLSADILGAKGEEARAGDACRAVLHRMPKEKYPQTWIQVLCSKWQFETPVPQKLVAGQKPAPWEVEWPALDEFNTQRDELQKLVPDSTSQDWARIMAARTTFWLSAAGCIGKERLVDMQKFGDRWFTGLPLPVELCKSARSAARAAQAVYTKELSPRLWMRLELLVNWGYISHCELGLEGLFNWGAAETVVSNVKDFTPLLDPERSPVEFGRAQTLKLFGLGHDQFNKDEAEMARTQLRLLDVADRLWPTGWLNAEYEVNDWEKLLEKDRGTSLDAVARKELLRKLERVLAALSARGWRGEKKQEKVELRLEQVRASLKLAEPTNAK